jgi:hypothetical protein
MTSDNVEFYALVAFYDLHCFFNEYCTIPNLPMNVQSLKCKKIIVVYMPTCLDGR